MVGSSHRYMVQWYWWGTPPVMGMQVDGRDVLYSDFDPKDVWGVYRTSSQYQDGWEPMVSSEIQYDQSNMPGQHGTSTFFSAMGSMADTTVWNWVGALGLNDTFHFQPTRFYLGPINAYNPNVYGINFDLYSY